MLLRGPGSSNHSLFWGKPIPKRDIQSFFIYSAYVLQKRKSCDEVVDGLYCHRGGWIQAVWGHWKAKHWRWWAGHLCSLSNTFMNAPDGWVVGYFEPDPNCWSKWLLAAPPSRHWLSAKRDTQSLLIHMRPCVPPEASLPFLYIVCRVQPGAPTHPKAAATFNRSPD